MTILTVLNQYFCNITPASLFVLAVLVSLVPLSIVQSNKGNKLDRVDNLIDKLNLSLSLYQLISEKGKPDGYVPLDVNGTIPGAFLPGFLKRPMVNLGCWNAQTNFPNIQSGIGEDSTFYGVCDSGTTNIDGFSEWFFGDRIFFSGELGQWIRLDGSTANMTVSGTGFPLFVDGNGPVFEMIKFGERPGSLKVDQTPNNETIILSISLSSEEKILNVGNGAKIIQDTNPPIYKLKTLTTESPLILTIGPSQLSINRITFPSQETLRSGSGTMKCGSVIPQEDCPAIYMGDIDFFWSDFPMNDIVFDSNFGYFVDLNASDRTYQQIPFPEPDYLGIGPAVSRTPLFPFGGEMGIGFSQASLPEPPPNVSRFDGASTAYTGTQPSGTFQTAFGFPLIKTSLFST